MKNDKLTILTAILTITLVSLGSAPAAENPSADAPSGDRAVIEKSIESCVAAFNAKDAKALAAHWSPEGVYIDRTSGQASGPAPTLYLQLQVNKEGIITGTLQNMGTNEVQQIEGVVDKKSQRSAWTVVGKS
jgi:ketosteroid isomerase-like protein